MIHSNTQQKRELEEFRYDAKLFKQAYNAGLEAKRMEAKAKQLRYIKVVVTIVSTLIVIISATWILSHLPKKYSYIKVQAIEDVVTFEPKKNPVLPSDSASMEFDITLVNAQSAIYADLNTGYIKYQKNIDEPLAVASFTKLVTAIVALEEFELDELVEVKQNWYEQEDMSWSLELDKGDSVSVESLLNAMLISSYNDAAYVLADHYDGGWEEFIKEMNRYIAVLGLENTHFSNPAGLDSEKGNISTVRDLYRLSTIIYKNQTIMDIMGKSYADLDWDIGSKRIFSTNALLNQYGIVAGKTGITDIAGQCFLGITKDGEVTIVLNSLDRFVDTKQLLLDL